MKNSTHIFIRMASLLVVAALLFPASALAVANGEVSVPPVLVTEIQPGTTTSGSQEFIELYNQSTDVINLSAEQWQVQITSSKAATWEGAKSVALTGMFYPGTYLLLSSNYTMVGESQSYLQQYASAQFSPGLTASSGHVRLVRTVNNVASEVSRLEWSTQTNGAYTSAGIGGAQTFALESAISAGSSIKRKVDATHIFMATSDVSQNFAVSPCPSPTSNNAAPDAPLAGTVIGPLPTAIDITNPLCEAPAGDSDEGELPASNTEPPAVLLPRETTPVTSGTATPSIPAADIGLSAPQITELLPNPGSPRTDAADEFVELYNPNAVAFDLSGFILEAGLTGNKHYTFPAGTIIPAHAFTAYFSETTKLSLSNTSGKVVLRDPLQRIIAQSDTYETAKDDTAWARANGAWYWTTQPTPSATNVIKQPAAKAKKSSSSGTSKKSAATGKTATSKQSAAPDTTQLASTTVEDTPLHPLTLAVVGAFALLYGAYEYRHDVANKFYQLRRYREARREARRQLKGR